MGSSLNFNYYLFMKIKNIFIIFTLVTSVIFTVFYIIEMQEQEAIKEAEIKAERAKKKQLKVEKCISNYEYAIQPLVKNFEVILERQKIITSFWDYVEKNKSSFKPNTIELQLIVKKYEEFDEYNWWNDYPDDNYPDYDDPYSLRYFAISDLNSASIDSFGKRHWIHPDISMFLNKNTAAKSALGAYEDDLEVYKNALDKYSRIQSINRYCKDNYMYDYNLGLNLNNY